MGYLFKIVKTNNFVQVADTIKFLSISGTVQKELGEPFKFSKDQTWYFAFEGSELVGLLVHNADTILYAYTPVLHRGKRIFSKLYAEIPDQKWKVLANQTSKPIFENLGFEVTKGFKIYFKMMKK